MATPERGRICGLSKEVTLAVLPRLHQEELLVELGRRNIIVGECYQRDSLVRKLWYFMVKEYQGTVCSITTEAPVFTGTISSTCTPSSTSPEQRNLWASLSHEIEELMETVTSSGGTPTSVPQTSTASSEHMHVTLSPSDGTSAEALNSVSNTGTVHGNLTVSQPSTPIAVSTPHHLPSFTQEVIVETTAGERSCKVTSPRRISQWHVLESNLALIGEAEETYQTPGENAAALGGQEKGRQPLRAMGVTRAQTHSVGSNTVVTDLGVVGSDTGVSVTDLRAVRELVDGPEEVQDEDDVSSDDGEDAGAQLDDDDPAWEPESPAEDKDVQSESPAEDRHVQKAGVTASSSGFAALFEESVTAPSSKKKRSPSSKKKRSPAKRQRTQHSTPKVKYNIVFKCSECEFTTDNRLKLLQHMTSHDETRLFVCKECGYRASRKFVLDLHMASHTGKPRYKCAQCDFSTMSGSKLGTHMAKKHGAQSFLCEHCGLRTASKQSLKVHMYIHTGEKPHKCPLCDFSHRIPIEIIKHMSDTHPGIPCYPCDQCSYLAVDKTTLNEHKNMHEAAAKHMFKCKVKHCMFSTDDKKELSAHFAEQHGGSQQYSCSVCNYKTFLKRELENHVKTHVGEKPFKCDKCSYTGKTYQALRTHSQVHDVQHIMHKLEKYFCDKCDYSSVKEGWLIRHRKTHEGENPFQCPHCEFNVDNQMDLTIHMGSKHSASITCDKCGYIAKNEENLELHIKQHSLGETYKCSTSGCNFSTPDHNQYIRHLTTHDPDRPFACESEGCNYRAKNKQYLSSHMMVHTREKPFKCSQCPYAGSLIHHLRRHELRHKNNVPHVCGICGFSATSKTKLDKHKKLHKS